jgi:hypothetical protein
MVDPSNPSPIHPNLLVKEEDMLYETREWVAFESIEIEVPERYEVVVKRVKVVGSPESPEANEGTSTV